MSPTNEPDAQQLTAIHFVPRTWINAKRPGASASIRRRGDSVLLGVKGYSRKLKASAYVEVEFAAETRSALLAALAEA